MAQAAQRSGTAQAEAAVAPLPGADLLEQAITATKQTEPQRAEQLLRTLTEQALEGTITYSKNLSLTITEAIKQIDAKISTQLAAVMHHPKFQQLEGSWRGLHFLTMNTETSATLKIRVMNWSKRELHRDLTRATEFDQSQLFKKIYESEFGTPGGEPYSALLGDFFFDNGQEDVELLRNISSVSAAAFAPFIAGASPKMFGFAALVSMG
jgi:type VI secretion system protein ImpC